MRVRAWNTLEHGFIAATDRMQTVQQAEQLLLAGSQEQHSRPPAHQTRQQGPAAPCCATCQAVLALAAVGAVVDLSPRCLLLQCVRVGSNCSFNIYQQGWKNRRQHVEIIS